MDDPGHASAPPTVAPSPTQPTPSAAPTPSKPPQIDEALDDKTALLYSPKAPHAGSDPEKKEDNRAVWAYIPAGLKLGFPEVLVYLHGHNYYVTATRIGAALKARVPDWVRNPSDGKPVPPVTERGAVAAKKKGDDQGPAGQWYELNQLDNSAPLPPRVSGDLPRQPLILLPEDSIGDNHQVLDKSGHEVAYFWTTEPAGTLANPDGLGNFIENCLKRLFDLPKLSGSTHYLSKEIKNKDLKRLFLIGHSGGGQSLKDAAKSDLAKSLPTDLVLLDCTYGHDGGGEDFCKSKGKANLGNALGQSRMIVVVTGGDTETSANALRNKLKDPAGLGLTSSALISVPPMPSSWPPTDILELSHNSDWGDKKGQQPWKTRPTANNYEPIKQAMKQPYKVIYIHTNEVHDRIPTVYIPLVLQSASAPAPLKIVTNSSLKSGGKEEAYSQTLIADGGIPPYKWSQTGGSLPGDVTLSEQGEISGKPSAGGTFKFKAQVQDDTSATDSKDFDVSIMEITTASPLPNGAKDEPYSQKLTVSGGKPPYTWSTTGGSLPPGVALSPAGDINGKPTDNDTFKFTVQVKDSASLTTSKEFELSIKWHCFIIGAAYGSELAPEVKFLQEIRETVLRQTDWGRRFFETYWRYYYRISPPIAEEMKRDPELQKTIRWSIVEPWTYYMKLLLSRPDWDRMNLDGLEPPLRDFLAQLRKDMDRWLSGIELPSHFAHVEPAEAVRELNIILSFILRTGGLSYLDDLVKRGELPLNYEPKQEAELLELLRQGGRQKAEIDRILYGRTA